ncbi:retrovirus-related pol polyprotein from transposon TNT 1-94 [Tanacetum coccineum]
MSNSNTNLQTQTSNALHNAIMEAGGKDRPPMLASGNYVQWKSRIKRYIDTKPNNELIHYCLQNPPYKFKWTEKTVPVSEGSSETTTEGYMENYKNVSQDIRDQLNAEAEAVQIILTGIDNDIYSTVDAYLKTNLYWEFGKFTSRDGESLESYYSRFYKMMNELVRNQCDVTNHQVNVQFLLQLQPEWQRFVTLVKKSQELKTVSYHKLYDILKQHQNEFNEIRAERLARTANPLALVAQQQPAYHPQNHPNHNSQYSSTRSQQATRNRGKAIVNSSAPTYDQEPAMVTEDDEMSKEKEIDKLMDLISLSGTGYENQRVVNVVGARENVGTLVVPKSGIQCYNCKEYGHVSRECQKPKRANDAAYHKENMLLYLKSYSRYFADISGPIFDTEPLQKVQNNHDNYNVFVIENEHPEQPESVTDAYLEEQGDTNIIIDSLDMFYDKEQDDQDDADELAQQRNLLASLIDKLKCKIDDSKNRNKFLESSHKAFVDKLKVKIKDFKTKNESLESSNNYFKEANNEPSKTNQLMFKDLKKFQSELDKYHDVNYGSKVATDCAKAKGDLMSYKIESEKSSNEYTRKINDLNQTISDMKKKLFAHQETISIMSQEKEAQIKFYKLRKTKELVKTNVKRLEKKLSKVGTIVKGVLNTSKHAINLELDLQQCIEKIKNDKSFKDNQSKVFLKEREQYFEIQDLKAQLQDKGIAINELKKLIEKMNGKSVETKFEKPSLVEIILFIVNSGCSKHMTGNLKLLTNFVENFLGMVKFGNDQIAPILGYGDLVQETITIKRVYYVEGLNHNLFSVGQLCDADLEVAFRKSTCYIRDLKGNDLLTGSRGTDLYSITLQDTSTPNPICLMAKATSSQAWLWHRRLLHLNFNTINLLSKNNIVTGLPKLKFVKDHLCSSCELRKAKRKSFHSKTTPSSKGRYTWTHFLRSKDETPEVLIDFLTHVQRGLHMASDHENVPQATETVTTSNELDFLFSPMFDELLNGTTLDVSKSSAVTTADALDKRQLQHTTSSSTTTVAPPLDIQTTPQTTNQAPTHVPTVNATENIIQA